MTRKAEDGRTIDALILSKMSGARLANEFESDFVFRPYVHEFFEFASAHRFAEFLEFQPRFLYSNQFSASSLVTSKTTAVFGPSADRLAVACIDICLLELVSRLLFEAVSCAPGCENGLIRRALYKTVQSIHPRRFKNFHEADLFIARSTPLENFVLNEEARKLGSRFTSAIDEMRGSRHEWFRIDGNVSPESNTPITWDYIANWIYSLSLHFCLGHECGHLLFLRREDNKYLHALWRKAEKIVQLRHGKEDPDSEEIFCDMLGAENCVFQAWRAGIWPWLTVLTAMWLVSFHHDFLFLKRLHEHAKPYQPRRSTYLARYWHHAAGEYHVTELPNYALQASFHSKMMFWAFAPKSESYLHVLQDALLPANELS